MTRYLYENEGEMWIGVFIFWVIGDLLTTIIGLSQVGIIELNPLFIDIRLAIHLKIITYLLFLFIFYLLRSKEIYAAYGIPIGLFLLGFGITLWNSYIIAQVIL